MADADAEIARAIEAKKPIVVGGTMMYLKCLLEGIADLTYHRYCPARELERELAERSAQSLHDELAQQDPEAAGSIHPNNHQRLLRAMAVVRATGQPMFRSGATTLLARSLSALGCVMKAL